jgi:hypothetical protein
MIEIIRQSDDLNRQVWQFDFMDYYNKPLVVLNYYRLQSRPTKRHNWRNSEYWERLGRGSSLKMDEVPLPDDVKQEALQAFMGQVRIVKDVGLREIARGE